MSEISSFSSISLVAAGGAFGAVLRHQLGLWLGRVLSPAMLSIFPWATLAANLLGSFAMGLLAGWLIKQPSGNETIRLLLGVGLLGGFTTFSSFSLELVMLIERGQALNALLYALVSVGLGLLGLMLGMAILRFSL